MNRIACWAVVIAVAAPLGAAQANSAQDTYLLNQITQGGPVSLRNAAKTIRRNGTASPTVLDTLAEAIYQNAADGNRHMIDAVAWSCKAFATIGNPRYSQTLHDAANNNAAHRKLRKHCKVAYNQLGAPSGPQYQPGMASMTPPPPPQQQYQQQQQGQAAAPPPRQQQAPTAAGQYAPITEVAVGMSMQEAMAIAGPPTSTTSHITGKAFIPFNFSGNDTARTIGLYKGQGRLVFSKASSYSSTMNVIEVQVDPNESGYP